MPSEWAMKKAADLLYQCGGEIYHSRTGLSVLGDALDAARIEGLEEAFALATEHCEHGEFTHMGRYECIDALRVDIRVRIREIKR